MDTGEKLINISHLADNHSQEHIAALMALHAFTCADCTSAFSFSIWRRALDHFPEISSPLDHGYHVTEAGKLEPLWFEGDVIPMVLVDILEENGNEKSQMKFTLLMIMTRTRTMSTMTIIFITSSTSGFEVTWMYSVTEYLHQIPLLVGFC